MGFGKSFLLSLVAFVGLNFVFLLLNAVIMGGFDNLMTTIQNAPLMIIYYLFGSIGSVPSINMEWAIVQPLFLSDTTLLITGIGYILAPLIAAILAGKFAESKLQGVAGWLLTVIISTVAVIVGVFLSPTVEGILTALYGWVGFEVILIFLVISCVVNIIFYGFFALLVSKTEYY